MSSAKKIELNSFDSLFGNVSEEEKTHVIEIELGRLHPFKNHPFKVLQDEPLQELAESINQQGVLVPIIVRPCDEFRYEIIAGHRRSAASRLAGKATIPAIVLDIDDDEATLMMVDTNIQRQNLLPSEKAFAYKLKMDVLRHQGSKGKSVSADEIGEEAGESGRQIQRYIRLTFLIPELLNLIDEKKVKFIAGVHLSYLIPEEQKWIYQVMKESSLSITINQAELLKKHSLAKDLTESMVQLLLLEKESRKRKVKIKSNKIVSYFPDDYSPEQMEQIIYELLEKWKSMNSEN